MKRLMYVISFISILVVFSLFKTNAYADEFYTYTDYSAVMEVTKETNIRTEPSLNGEKVGFYPAGTEIEVTGLCNETGWYRIEYEGETRYLSNIYLNLVLEGNTENLSSDINDTTFSNEKEESSILDDLTEGEVKLILYLIAFFIFVGTVYFAEKYSPYVPRRRKRRSKIDILNDFLLYKIFFDD